MKRISITGPESTGKSWLAEQLAGIYTTLFVPEFAREYLQKLNRPYTFEDIATIAKEQLKRENYLAGKACNVLFCDTDLLVTKVWSYYKYGKCDPWIEKEVNRHHYDLYLLCDIDLPWEEDPLREHPDRRKELFDIYHIELKKMNANYRIISGTGIERLNNAIYFINSALEVDIA